MTGDSTITDSTGDHHHYHYSKFRDEDAGPFPKGFKDGILPRKAGLKKVDETGKKALKNVAKTGKNVLKKVTGSTKSDKSKK